MPGPWEDYQQGDQIALPTGEQATVAAPPRREQPRMGDVQVADGVYVRPPWEDVVASDPLTQGGAMDDQSLTLRPGETQRYRDENGNLVVVRDGSPNDGRPPFDLTNIDGGDIGTQFRTGLEQGVAGVLSIPGQIANMTKEYSDWGAMQTGDASPTPIIDAAARNVPDAQDFERQFTDGQGYAPARTTLGEYARTAGQFAPGLLAGPEALVPTVTGALTSETSGQAARAMGADQGTEDAARFVGGMVGSMAPGSRMSSPAQAPTVSTGPNSFRFQRAMSAPRTGRAADVQTLRDAGVRMTPGQIMGGPVQAIENMAGKAPIMGPAVRAAQQRSVDSLNRAPFLRATSEIGQPLPRDLQPGAETVDYAYNQIGQAFDDAIGKVPQIAPDADFIAARQAVEAQASTDLPAEQASQFVRMLDSRLGRIQGGTTGEQFRAVQREFADLSRRYASGGPDQQALSGLLGDVSEAMLDQVGRTNPQAGQELSRARTAYAQYIRGERASTAANGEPFSPQQLANAVKMTDSSVRRGQIARGQGMMQDLSGAAVRVMGRQMAGNPGVENTVGLGMVGGALVPNPGQPAAIGATATLGAGAAGYHLMAARGIVESLPPGASTEQLRRAAQQLQQLSAQNPQAAAQITPLLEDLSRRISQASGAVVAASANQANGQ